MNATVPLLRWLGIGAMLAGMTLAAQAQYQFRTEVNPDGTLTVRRGDSCPTGELVIPDTIDGRRVISIGGFGFYGCGGLTTITIPDGVVSIGEDAFLDCFGLRAARIPDSVTRIGLGAFYGPRFDEILFNVSRTILVRAAWPSVAGSYPIPDGVTTIAPAAFYGLIALTDLTIPSAVTNIGPAAFSDCSRLGQISVDLGNAYYTSVAGVLFDRTRSTLVGYPGGKSGAYDIPPGVTRIGLGAFAGSGLTRISIPGSVTQWEDGASREYYTGTFQGCMNLREVRILDGVTHIGSHAFTGCYALAEVVIPNSVTNIGAGAFSACIGLSSITIPSSVVSIGDAAFAGCNLTNLTIPDSVARIGEATFSGCAALNDVVIGSGVRVLGRGAFASCQGLRRVAFQGDAPTEVVRPFENSTAVTVYRLPGTVGWGPTFDGRRTALWVRPNPTILDFGDRFGPSPTGFGFVISWATNVPVVVEASADIGNPTWTPISTNTLTDGWVQFTDPDWRSQPAKFYRVRGQ